MKAARWLDHLPPWMAWGAVASTGYYSGWEVAGMALPLLLAAFVEGRDLSLLGLRRALELAALAIFLALVLSRAGVLPTMVLTLFVLCGVRLCLPRQPPQRRQILLMGFLAFLSSAVATFDLDFLAWSLAWAAGSALVLMQLAWEGPARFRQGPAPRPPFGRIPLWTAGVVLAGCAFFVLLPRLRLGVRNLPMAVHGLGGLRAGFSDVLDLSGQGPIQGEGGTALRIVPRERTPAFEQAFGLLKGVVLEDLDGQRWSMSQLTPWRSSAWWNRSGGGPFAADMYVSPNALGVVPLPCGPTRLRPSPGEQLRAGPGASVRWVYPVRRILELEIEAAPPDGEPERAPSGARLELLTRAGPETDCALRFSLRTAPGDLPARALAQRLTAALQGYRYTLDNPSGGASNPMEDFLERSRAGHCEFFASSLAAMLRRRGVPARVVNGYRLGAWVEAGSYYLVTQNEAHSWVEYYDPETRLWLTADPTPAGAAAAAGPGVFRAALERWADAARFQWDRHVVRFSDEDQLAGFDWLREGLGGLASGPEAAWLKAAAAALALLAAAGLAWYLAVAFRHPGGAGPGPGRIPELRALVRRAGREGHPLEGETAASWLARLARQRPDRARPLEALAREADAVAYGGKGRTALARMAREESRAWGKRQQG